AQLVDADAPRELRDPRLDRLVAAQGVEPLVDLRKDLLEDVLGVVVAQPEALRRDRVDVAREALDELGPRAFIPGAATGDKLSGRDRLRHRNLDRDLLLLRFAEPLRHHLEEPPSDLRVRLDEGPELPSCHAIAGEIGIRGDRRGAARMLVDERDFSEVVAGPELSALLAVNVDARRPLADHEEADAALALDGHRVARAEAALLEGGREPFELAVRQPLEEGDLLEQLYGRLGHDSILSGYQATL